MFAGMFAGRVDILFVSETRINGTFPSSTFQIRGYTNPYGADRTRNKGDILFCIK